jgi:hypothetical protein
MDEHDDWLAQRFEEQHTHLRAVAYCMLGILSLVWSHHTNFAAAVLVVGKGGPRAGPPRSPLGKRRPEVADPWTTHNDIRSSGRDLWEVSPA